MENEPVFIYGAGGFGKVVCDILQTSHKKLMFIDDDKDKKNWYGREVIIPSNLDPSSQLVIALGNNGLRKELFRRFSQAKYLNVIDGTSFVSATAKLGTGSIILAHSAVYSDAVLGKGTILNTGCVIDHDAVVGDFVHLRHNVVVSASATIENGCTIGEHCVIGRGARVTANTVLEPYTLHNLK